MSVREKQPKSAEFCGHFTASLPHGINKIQLSQISLSELSQKGLLTDFLAIYSGNIDSLAVDLNLTKSGTIYVGKDGIDYYPNGRANKSKQPKKRTVVKSPHTIFQTPNTTSRSLNPKRLIDHNPTTPEDFRDTARNHRVINDLIEGLELPSSRVVYKRLYAGSSYEEISRMVKLSPEKVCELYHQSRVEIIDKMRLGTGSQIVDLNSLVHFPDLDPTHINRCFQNLPTEVKDPITLQEHIVFNVYFGKNGNPGVFNTDRTAKIAETHRTSVISCLVNCLKVLE